jgi:hypothetical protein
MSAETLLAAGYASALILGAFALEWLSAHTHRRGMRFRTQGFTYDETHDNWRCPEGQHLWPHEFDHERRMVRYRAKAHICNGCPVKERCTESTTGREIVRALDPWPHSEAGRFHRIVCVTLIVLAVFIVLAAGVRNRRPDEIALLLGVLVAATLAARWLVRDLRVHPANFSASTVGHGLRVVATAADGERARSRWASQNRPEGT